MEQIVYWTVPATTSHGISTPNHSAEGVFISMFGCLCACVRMYMCEYLACIYMCVNVCVSCVLYIRVCVCLCVCVRERERARERVCARVCDCVFPISSHITTVGACCIRRDSARVLSASSTDAQCRVHKTRHWANQSLIYPVSAERLARK